MPGLALPQPALGSGALGPPGLFGSSLVTSPSGSLESTGSLEDGAGSVPDVGPVGMGFVELETGGTTDVEDAGGMGGGLTVVVVGEGLMDGVGVGAMGPVLLPLGRGATGEVVLSVDAGGVGWTASSPQAVTTPHTQSSAKSGPCGVEKEGRPNGTWSTKTRLMAAA